MAATADTGSGASIQRQTSSTMGTQMEVFGKLKLTTTMLSTELSAFVWSSTSCDLPMEKLCFQEAAKRAQRRGRLASSIQLYLTPPKMFSLVKAQRFLNASLAAQKEYEDKMGCNLQ